MSSPKKKSIYFFMTTPNHSRLFSRIAFLLERNAEFQAVPFDLRKFVSSKSILTEENFKNIKIRKLLRKIENKIWRIKLILCFEKYVKEVCTHLEPNNPGGIVLCDQYLNLRSVMATRIGKELAVPVALLPYVNPILEDTLKIRSTNKVVTKESNSIIGRLVKNIYPHWKTANHKKCSLWANPLEVLGIELWHGSIQNPQRGVCDLVDFVFLQTELAKRRILEFGFDKRKISVIGDVVEDIFYNEKKNHVNWKRERGWGKKKILLYSIVPDLKQKTIYGNYKDYLSNYADLLGVLRDAGWVIICNPHPSTKDDAIEFFKERGFVVCQQDLAFLMPHADFYLTSYSSTLQWASLLKIPSVDHDLYSMKYKTAQTVPLVSTLYTVSELDNVIRNLADNTNYHQQLVKEEGDTAEVFEETVLSRILTKLKKAL